MQVWKDVIYDTEVVEGEIGVNLTYGMEKRYSSPNYPTQFTFAGERCALSSFLTM